MVFGAHMFEFDEGERERERLFGGAHWRFLMLLGTLKPWNIMEHMFTVVKLCLAPREAMPVPAPVPVPRKKVAAQKDSQRPSGTTLQRIALGCKRTLGRSHSKSSSCKYPRIFNNLQQTGNSHPRLSVISCDFTSLISNLHCSSGI